MSIGNLIFVPLCLMALTRPTYGLPTCAASVTGFTERYEAQTLYIDLCENGTIIEENLKVIQLTTSIIMIEHDGETITIPLPE